MLKHRVIKDHVTAEPSSFEVIRWNGKTFRSGKRYGDRVIARYYIDFDGEVPKLIKDKDFKPYKNTGWGGSDFDGHKGIDYEAIEVKKALDLDRNPTEEEIKEYFEG